MPLGPTRSGCRCAGGPPCRTVSRLRHRAPGPRPLRGRDDRRFMLEGLSSVEQEAIAL